VNAVQEQGLWDGKHGTMFCHAVEKVQIFSAIKSVVVSSNSSYDPFVQEGRWMNDGENLPALAQVIKLTLGRRAGTRHAQHFAPGANVICVRPPCDDLSVGLCSRQLRF
jgi:hypothetical protein